MAPSFRGPLAGIRVVELAGIGPGPFAAMLLSELGADVVRVDRPAAAGRKPPGLTRGRRSVVADLKVPEGRDAVLRLAERADVLIEGFPCWIVTVPAMEQIKAAKLTGVSFKDVEISTSEQFKDLHRTRRLPAFVRLEVNGRPGHDDFGFNKSFPITGMEKLVDARRFTLVISERAIKILKALGISHASVYEFTEENS